MKLPNSKFQETTGAGHAKNIAKHQEDFEQGLEFLDFGGGDLPAAEAAAVCGAFLLGASEMSESISDERAACVVCGSEKVKFVLEIEFSQVDVSPVSGDVYRHYDLTAQTNYFTAVCFCEAHRPDLEAMLKGVSGSDLARPVQKYFHQ